jgi:DNA-binding IclR family transcriptional regulator
LSVDHVNGHLLDRIEATVTLLSVELLQGRSDPRASPASIALMPDSHHVDSSAAKTLRLLDAFATGQQAVLGVTELAQLAQLPKSTTHRLLSTLLDQHYVRRVGDRYCLTNRVFELGNRVGICRPNGLRESAMPFLADLYAATRETVHLAVLQGVDVLYLEKLFGPNSVRSGTAVGGRKKAHATALGRAMLANSGTDVCDSALRQELSRYTPYTQVNRGSLERTLQHVRERGFATDQQEMLLGMVCVAAPVRDPCSGRVLAAVSVSAHASTEAVRKLSPKVVNTAAAISQQLGSAVFAV